MAQPASLVQKKRQWGHVCMYNASRDRATLRISLLQPVFAMSELNSRKLIQMTEKSSRD